MKFYTLFFISLSLAFSSFVPNEDIQLLLDFYNEAPSDLPTPTPKTIINSIEPSTESVSTKVKPRYVIAKFPPETEPAYDADFPLQSENLFESGDDKDGGYLISSDEPSENQMSQFATTVTDSENYPTSYQSNSTIIKDDIGLPLKTSELRNSKKTKEFAEKSTKYSRFILPSHNAAKDKFGTDPRDERFKPLPINHRDKRPRK